jgi:hypothetical protein
MECLGAAILKAASAGLSPERIQAKTGGNKRPDIQLPKETLTRETGCAAPW